MKLALTFLRWFFGIFFLISFLSFLTTDIVRSIASLLLGIILIKPLAQFVYRKISYRPSTKILFAIGVLLFVVATFTEPKTAAENVTKLTPTLVPTATTTKATSIPTPKPTESPTTTPTSVPPTPTIYYPTATPRVYIAPTETPQSNTYPCDCNLTCTEISSCAEAQYELNTCGCIQRDSDHDGIACDSGPLHCEN